MHIDLILWPRHGGSDVSSIHNHTQHTRYTWHDVIGMIERLSSLDPLLLGAKHLPGIIGHQDVHGRGETPPFAVTLKGKHWGWYHCVTWYDLFYPPCRHFPPCPCLETEYWIYPSCLPIRLQCPQSSVWQPQCQYPEKVLVRGNVFKMRKLDFISEMIFFIHQQLSFLNVNVDVPPSLIFIE